jgi:NAD+ diphosphatase
MLHEIHPRQYHVEYTDHTPAPDDTVFLFDAETVCCHLSDGKAAFPKFADFPGTDSAKMRYLFSIDKERFFMADDAINPPDGLKRQDFSIFFTAVPRHLMFAVITARSLYQWDTSRRFCGSCGTAATHSETERACVCPKCNLIEYPKISPVVIVAVTNGENLLVIRYRNSPYQRYALVAGFAEIGESLEDTVRREVFEETGIRVKNIKYYKSSPWGFTSTLLSGFYCELDGDPAITVDENELSEALWLPRGEIPPAESDIALTAEMMEMFRTGSI